MLTSQPALFLAALKGQQATVQALIEHGAERDRRTRFHILDFTDNGEQLTATDSTALIVSSRLGHTEVVRLLLSAGADPHIRDGEGLSALEWARKNNHREVAALFERQGIHEARVTSEEQLIKAAQEGNEEEVKHLLSYRVPADCRDSRREAKGWTPLMHASAGKSTEVLRMLMDHGTDVRAKDFAGFTPLLLAVEAGRADAAREILSAIADGSLE